MRGHKQLPPTNANHAARARFGPRHHAHRDFPAYEQRVAQLLREGQLQSHRQPGQFGLADGEFGGLVDIAEPPEIETEMPQRTEHIGHLDLDHTHYPAPVSRVIPGRQRLQRLRGAVFQDVGRAVTRFAREIGALPHLPHAAPAQVKQLSRRQGLGCQ